MMNYFSLKLVDSEGGLVFLWDGESSLQVPFTEGHDTDSDSASDTRYYRMTVAVTRRH